MAELLHHDVAGVDAAGAGDALELEAVPDVDALRTDDDALVAVDAAPCVLGVGSAARLAPADVVLHQQRVGVGQGALEAGVGAEVVAELLPEPGQVEEPDGGEDRHEGVLQRAPAVRSTARGHPRSSSRTPSQITKRAARNTAHLSRLPRRPVERPAAPDPACARCTQSPSIHSSIGRIQVSRKTVWGQANPHQSRPKSEVKKNSEKARNRSRRSRKIVSDAVKMAPNAYSRRARQVDQERGIAADQIHGVTNRMRCSRMNVALREVAATDRSPRWS